VTCNGRRHLYNGWLSRTKDIAMDDANKNSLMPVRNAKYPCNLIPFDWISENIDFCLNPSKCNLKKIKPNTLAQKLCFNPSFGERTYLLVRKGFKPPTAKPQFPKVPTPSPTTKSKECPKGKIINPKTNRCVKVDGAIGKKILSGK
jgi:hypothetical protein